MWASHQPRKWYSRVRIRLGSWKEGLKIFRCFGKYMTKIPTTQLNVSTLHTSRDVTKQGQHLMMMTPMMKSQIDQKHKREKSVSQSHICGLHCFTANGIWSQKISAKGWGSTKLACCTMAKAISISVPSLLTRGLYLSRKLVLKKKT